MKILISLSAVAVLVLIALVFAFRRRSTSQPLEKAILGRWTVINGDYPLSNEYRADGTLIQRMGGSERAPLPYRVDGDVLIYSVEQPDGSIFEQKMKFKIAGDTMTCFGDSEHNVVLKRGK
jgi:hypothetical protein